MTLEQLSNDLMEFKNRFESLYMRWSLGCKAYLNGRVISDLPDAFRRAFIYGSSTARDMRLNITEMHIQGMHQADLVVKWINDSIPSSEYYANKVRACREELLFNFGLHEELKWLFDLHKEQMSEFTNLKGQLIIFAQSMLKGRIPSDDVVELISNWQLMCQSYSQLHEDFTEQEKNSVMRNLLHEAGIPYHKSICHPHQLEVFVVPKQGQLGSKFIGYYADYESTKVVFTYLNQLCRAARAYDDRIILVVGIGEYSLAEIFKSVRDPLFLYDVFINPKVVSDHRLDFSVRLRPENSAEILVTIFMVNHWKSPHKDNVRWFE